MGDSGTETSNKRLKTDNSALDNSSHWSGKGKAKLEQETNCCGICFSGTAAEDAYNSVSRGCIDSCDHYFCFVCIMEWAKLESKCPLCKRRFSTIRRPAKPPVFPSDRLIHVPVRDQAYDCFGNAITGPSDPYAEANCSVCQRSEDESLLLLCDLCDSSSHTYCVGLGAAVPEADWFCHDCTLIRDEHNKAEIDPDTEGEQSSCDLSESLLEEEEHVSIFDIVAEPWDKTPESLERITGQRLRRVFVNGAINSDACLEEDLNVSDSRRQECTTHDEQVPALLDSTVSDLRKHEHAMHNTTKFAARTLRQRRNVHERIKALRDNWNSIRNGSLSFCSGRNDHGHGGKPYCVNSGQSNSFSSLSHNVRTVCSRPTESGKMGQSGSASCSTEKVTSINGQTGKPEIFINSGQSSSTSSIQNREISIGCRGTSSNADSSEISKAWKMLGIAKTIGIKSSSCSKNGAQLHLSKRRGNNLDSLASMRRGNNLDRCNAKKSQNMLKTQILKRQNHSNFESERYNSGSGILPHMLERQNHSNLESGRNSSGSVVLPTHSNCQLISSDNVFLSVQHESRNRRGGSSNDKISIESIHTATNYCERSTSMSLSNDPVATALNIFPARREIQSQLSSQEGPSVTKVEEGKPSDDSNILRNCDAKSEIQSLVKLNLKLLTRAKKLETDVFKQVARSATHSILVACDLEYPKPGIHEFFSSVCSHEETNIQFRRSTLMPSSCRECFYSFVKDVVNAILLEKTGDRKLS